MNGKAEIVVEGNLTRGLETKHSAAGTVINLLSVAVNRSWKKGEDWQSEVTYINVTMFGALDINLREKLLKGARVSLVGRLQQNRWMDSTGANRSSYTVITKDVLVDTPNAKREPVQGMLDENGEVL